MSKTKIALDKDEAAKIVGRIKEEVDNHHASVTELKTKLERLSAVALRELLKVKELTHIIERLKENWEKQELPPPADEPKDHWKKDSSPDLEKLVTIETLVDDSFPEAPVQQSPQPPPPPSNGQKKILVVDDDPTTVKIIQHFLVKENYAVLTSLSGIEGLKKAFRERPDLILLDIMMPELDGFQFLSIFHKDAECSRIPVVVLSALAEEADILRGLDIGAADYITKPFSPSVLMAKIKKCLDLHP